MHKQFWLMVAFLTIVRNVLGKVLNILDCKPHAGPGSVGPFHFLAGCCKPGISSLASVYIC